jgi:predicted amidophosphoribosyltransferase
VKVLAECIEANQELKNADAIIAMPRKIPDKPSDMQVIADGLAERFGFASPTNWMVRTKTPERGQIIDHRLRFAANDHAESFKVIGEDIFGGIIILDNVLTTGSTMEGAILAIQRDTKAKACGLAVLYSDIS